MKKISIGQIIGFILILFLGYQLFFAETTNIQTSTYLEVKEQVEANNVSSIVLSDGGTQIEALLKNENTILTSPNPNTEESKNFLYTSGIPMKTIKSSMSTISTIIDWVFSITLIILIFSMLGSFGKKGVGGGMFNSDMDLSLQDSKITFKDVAGSEENKEVFTDLEFYLKNPEKFKEYGVKPPKGVILWGPPGTGKTLLAKALAGEANVNFMSVSGSIFVDKFVGNGASRVRSLFAKAREVAPCILFIDEIDAVGCKRDGTFSNEERNQTLNELLAAMDGFKDDEGIIVIGATNRFDSLDPALTRSGRFDTKIYVGLPDLKSREEIFKVHSVGKPVDENLDYTALAKLTSGMSGADISNIMNKAGFIAAKEESKLITIEHVDRAISSIMVGDSKKDRSSISEATKKLTAYHEAGHAIMAKLYAKHNVPKITIIPTTHGAGGYTLHNPAENEDRTYLSKKEIYLRVAISLGGRVAEEIILGKDGITTGASSDIKYATNLLVSAIGEYGMGDTFGCLYVGDDRELKEKVLEEAKKVLDSIYNETLNYLTENRALLNSLALELLDKETVNEDMFDEIIAKIKEI